MIPPVDLSRITIDKLTLPLLLEKKLEASVLRLDKIHPLISGNKWFKLRFYLEEARTQNKKHIVTFGGAWSNHLLATAAACRQQGFKSTGIIRGEQPAILSPTLQQCIQMGMHLIFSSREEYRLKKIPDSLASQDLYLVPEGGYGFLGAAGAATILETFPAQNYSHMACAVGTGTMMAGLINAKMPDQMIIGISVLRNNDDLVKSMRHLTKPADTNYKIIHDYHFGGYAKYTQELFDHMNDFYRQSGIPSDFVYTGKLFAGITDMINKDLFPSGSRILIIHSGGLQGNASLGKGTLMF
jgi:1-aminocyclopropane-1-carboxylate deaminase/D-cysteine desulfhydrase-like pyridoxal-dependent ACC family enzyme